MSAGIRRVTALLHGDHHGGEILSAATQIAARLHADVQALLVEDANLRRMARLEVTRTVSLFGAAGPLVPAELGALFEQLAAEAEGALRVAARSLGVAWSFQVVRGDPMPDVPGLVDPAELLVVGPARHGPVAREGLGLDLWMATAGRATSVLLLERMPRRMTPAVLVTTPSEAAARALAIGAGLLANGAPRLDVLLAAPGDAASADWARQQSRALGRRVHVEMLADCATDTVARAARRAGAGILIVPADSPCLMDRRRIESLAERADCALLLSR